MAESVLTAALAAAQRREPEFLPVLRRWVEQNSYTADVAAVNALADLLVADFSLPELTVERRPGNDFGDHLVWRTPAYSARPDARVLLLGHHDTVHAPGSFDVWEVEGDRLRGPGVLDMKGGLLVIHAALTALSEVGALAELPLAVFSVGDEELGSPDSRAWVQDLARGAREALVFEAGRAEDAIITRRKGTGKFNVKAVGKAAHAGNFHQDGINAVRALARVVDQMEALTDYARGVTVNVGIFHGGSSANTVPDSAECLADFRFVRASDGEDTVRAVDRIAREVGQQTGARLLVEGGIRRPPLERSEASVALYRRYAACAEPAGLGTGECDLIGGGSDANTVSAVGVPTIDGMGPRGRHFHTQNEYIEISSLAMRVEALIRFLMS